MTKNKRMIQNQIEYAQFIIDMLNTYKSYRDYDDRVKYIESLRDKLNHQIEVLEDEIVLKEHEADFIQATLRGVQEDQEKEKEDD